jgi:YHS domain-containing protein/outer membrane lipoprotein-sorting protein
MTMTSRKTHRRPATLLALLATRRFWTEKWFLIPSIAVFLAGLVLIFGLDLLNLRGTGDQGGYALSAEHTDLVQDPVCGSWVDPQETPYKISYMGYDFYFDSQECLDKFRSNPLAYLRMKLRINVGMRNTPSAPSTDIHAEPPPGPGPPAASRVPKTLPPPKPAPRPVAKKPVKKSVERPAPPPPRSTPPPAKETVEPPQVVSTPKPPEPASTIVDVPAPGSARPPSSSEPGTAGFGSYSPSEDEKRKDYLARQLVDHLYITANQMPVQDMVIEMDNFKASKDPGAARLGPNLILSSSDKIFFKSPFKVRIDAVVSMPGGAGDRGMKVIIRDGTHRWLFVPQAQYPVKKGADEPSPMLALPFNIQRYPAVETNKLYAIVGSETVGGVRSEVVRIVDPVNKDDIITVWIDKARWVPVKLEKTVSGKDKPMKKRVMYKDVRALADGRNMPFLLEVYENEGLVSVYEYKRVAVNTGVPTSLFQPMDKFVR